MTTLCFKVILVMPWAETVVVVVVKGWLVEEAEDCDREVFMFVAALYTDGSP